MEGNRKKHVKKEQNNVNQTLFFGGGSCNSSLSQRYSKVSPTFDKTLMAYFEMVVAHFLLLSKLYFLLSGRLSEMSYYVFTPEN